jgi:Patatin-like phospholipase
MLCCHGGVLPTHVPRHAAVASAAACKPMARRNPAPSRAAGRDTSIIESEKSSGSGGAGGSDMVAAETACVRSAFLAGSLAFGFSAGGLLFPYYLGVAEALQDAGVLREETPVAGASAGSLIAACLKSGLPLHEITTAMFDLADDCRTGGTRHRLGPVLARVLREVLPVDVAERASGRAHVAVTHLAPRIRPRLVTRFRDREDLIAALLTSCHIPWYFDGRLLTTFRRRPCFDGGITDFLPSVPNAAHTVRVCCLPAAGLSRIGRVSIAPDMFEDWPHSTQTMLGWAFEPAEDAQLRELIAAGRRHASAWLHMHGLHELDPPALPDVSRTEQTLVVLPSRTMLGRLQDGR